MERRAAIAPADWSFLFWQPSSHRFGRDTSLLRDLTISNSYTLTNTQCINAFKKYILFAKHIDKTERLPHSSSYVLHIFPQIPVYNEKLRW